MARSYQAIDADGHILEPLDLSDKYMGPGFYDRRPRFVIDGNGKERLAVDSKLLGNPRGIGSLSSVGVPKGTVKLDSLKYAEGKKGGFDTHARILDMDADGIDAAFLYPSLGLFTGAVEDPGLAAAMCRAYNRRLLQTRVHRATPGSAAGAARRRNRLNSLCNARGAEPWDALTTSSMPTATFSSRSICGTHTSTLPFASGRRES